jgi:hypothetical protein
MVPLIVEAAEATPGHIAAASNPAARHILFAVLRILFSFLSASKTPRPPGRVSAGG